MIDEMPLSTAAFHMQRLPARRRHRDRRRRRRRSIDWPLIKFGLSDLFGPAASSGWSVVQIFVPHGTAAVALLLSSADQNQIKRQPHRNPEWVDVAFCCCFQRRGAIKEMDRLQRMKADGQPILILASRTKRTSTMRRERKARDKRGNVLPRIVISCNMSGQLANFGDYKTKYR
jgi:hypothetical protein